MGVLASFHGGGCGGLKRLTDLPKTPTIPGGGPRIPSRVLYADLVWSPHRTYSPPSNPIPCPRRGIIFAESHWGEDPAWLICFPGYHLWVWMRPQGELKDRHGLSPGGSLFIQRPFVLHAPLLGWGWGGDRWESARWPWVEVKGM